MQPSANWILKCVLRLHSHGGRSQGCHGWESGGQPGAQACFSLKDEERPELATFRTGCGEVDLAADADAGLHFLLVTHALLPDELLLHRSADASGKPGRAQMHTCVTHFGNADWRHVPGRPILLHPVTRCTLDTAGHVGHMPKRGKTQNVCGTPVRRIGKR